MSILAEGLQPSVLPGLFSATGRLPSIRMSDGLTAKAAAYDLSFISVGNVVSTDFRDRSYVSQIVAADCSRLSVAALQSVMESNRLAGDKFAIPWSLIKAYYAAFYAGHAIVRILGGGCCWLETSHVDRIRDGAQALGIVPPFRLDTGNYQCQVSNSGTAFHWTRMSAGRGTHESFWHYFEVFVRSKAADVLTGSMVPADAQAAFSQLSALLDLGAARRSSSWMSRVRNEIQYQFEHSVWHASALSARDREALSRLVQQWEVDPMAIDLMGGKRFGDIGDLAVAAAFLVSLCSTLLQRVADRGAGRTKSFVHFGPAGFLSHRRRH
jgi:hypothetical protein